MLATSCTVYSARKSGFHLSVSQSQIAKTVAYIQKQKDHHHRGSFQEEFIELLDKHGIEYERRYVFR
jgi:putative transposase